MNPIPCSVWIRLLHQGLWQPKANYSPLYMLLLNTRRMGSESHANGHKRPHAHTKTSPYNLLYVTQTHPHPHPHTLLIFHLTQPYVDEPQLLKSSVFFLTHCRYSLTSKLELSSVYYNTYRRSYLYSLQFQTGPRYQSPNIEGDLSE